MEALVDMLKQVPDPRRSGGNKQYDLEMILLAAIICVAKGRTTFRAMSRAVIFDSDVFIKFLGRPFKAPHEETFRRILSRINPDKLAEILLFGAPIVSGHIAIDGKHIRGTESSVNVVSAWNTSLKRVIYQRTVPQSSNEISATKDILNHIESNNCIFTADAINCQTDIAQMIIDNKNNYVPAVKKNQKGLFENIDKYMFNRSIEYTDKLVEHGHGRVDSREYGIMKRLEDIPDLQKWPGIKAIGYVYRKSYNKRTRKESVEVRYYITSLTDLQLFAQCVRDHWSIENHLHWRLDALFSEDNCRVRKGNTPVVLNILRKFVLYAFDNFDKSDESLVAKRELVQDNEDALIELLSLAA